MQVLHAQKINLSFGTLDVLKGADLSVESGSRIGLVGRNGAGKSTFLRVITGQYAPDSGQVVVPRGVRVGYLEQLVGPPGEGTVWEQLLAVFSPVFAMEEELRELEHRMGLVQGAEYERVAARYDQLSRAFEDAGGYSYKSRMQGTLNGLGFTAEQYDQPAATLSGGQQARLALAKLLLSAPDLLLLDEPTNHLDLAAVQWLEDFLRAFRGAIVIVSHDRYFLDALCGSIAEVSNGAITRYEGNYTSYLSQRRIRREQQEKAFRLQQQEIRRQEEIIERLKSYNREKSLKRARSREKVLDKVELLDRPDEDETLVFRFRADVASGGDVLMAENLTKGFGSEPLFSDFNLHVRSGDRVAIIGPNGCGKSTLLKILCGRLAPDRGFVRRGVNVEIGYFDQQQAELLSDNTVLDELHDCYPQMTAGQLRNALAVFYFRGDDVFKDLSSLSGGEKARLALLKLMLHHDNTLLLDEPTNHLDSDVREALGKRDGGLRGYVPSPAPHDRYFINRFANRIVSFQSDGGVIDVPGNYDDYLAYLERLKNPNAARNDEGPTRTAVKKQQKQSRETTKQRQAARIRSEQAEREVARLEEEVEACGAKLSDASLSPEELIAESSRYAELEEQLARAMEEWEAAAEAYEAWKLKKQKTAEEILVLLLFFLVLNVL